ncbi:unnamed protein product [Effrenium voratum]|uniref:Uncharacterized protein n=1 Tax=Effrenium voratum TaxID=2562239 RepID=A0AA36J6Y9_9DINO|nr:unnamed protein product [Effrenium voratum]CAJ1439491.1 unnamed protein product [Effrenium voratum]
MMLEGALPRRPERRPATARRPRRSTAFALGNWGPLEPTPSRHQDLERDLHACTVLHRLGAQDEAEALAALLTADAKLGGHLCAPQWLDEAGRSPLHYAARAGAARTTRLLLEAGARVNAADHFGYTALHEAAATPREVLTRVEVAWRLLDAQAEVGPKPRLHGSSPLHLAARHGHEALAAMLLQRLADPGARDAAGLTALEVAISHQHHEAARLLEQFRPLSLELGKERSAIPDGGVVWVRKTAAAAEVCGRAWAAFGRHALAPFCECEVYLPGWPVELPQDASDFLRHRRCVHICPIYQAPWELFAADEDPEELPWTRLWARPYRCTLRDLAWKPTACRGWQVAELSNSNALAAALKNIFNQGARRLQATPLPLRLLSSAQWLAAFQAGIAHLEGQMFFSIQQDPGLVQRLHALRLPAPDVGSLSPWGGLARPAELLKLLESHAECVCGAAHWRLQRTRLALAWATEDVLRLESCDGLPWTVAASGDRAQLMPPGWPLAGAGDQTVVAVLVAFATSYPTSELRSYRRHFFGPTLLEPGFDLHVLCGEGPAAKAQRAYPAEYQLMAMESAQVLPIAAIDVRPKQAPPTRLVPVGVGIGAGVQVCSSRLRESIAYGAEQNWRAREEDLPK